MWILGFCPCGSIWFGLWNLHYSASRHRNRREGPSGVRLEWRANALASIPLTKSQTEMSYFPFVVIKHVTDVKKRRMVSCSGLDRTFRLGTIRSDWEDVGAGAGASRSDRVLSQQSRGGECWCSFGFLTFSFLFNLKLQPMGWCHHVQSGLSQLNLSRTLWGTP